MTRSLFGIAACCVMAIVCSMPRAALAHEARPALLEITQRADGRYNVLWKRPTQGALAVRLIPHVSGGWLDAAPDMIDRTSTFQVSAWHGLDGGGQGLSGRTLEIEGLERTITDVLVSIHLASGSSTQHVLNSKQPRMLLNLRAGVAVPAYLVLGVRHILAGVDHLSFVLALMLLVRGRVLLIKTVTAFTVAHSITLAVTVLGGLRLSVDVVEMLVALSIVFVAVELVRSHRGQPGLTARYPWVIAFTFGLLHGAAFAGALEEVGLPHEAVPAALLLFNVGVEIGQLSFIVAVLSVAWVLRRWSERNRDWMVWGVQHAIGVFGAYWFFDRLHIALS